MSAEDVKTINKRLKKLYGRITDETPIFRVVWSEDQLEWRRGNFRDFSPSGLFLRDVVETRQVKKYPHIKERWILEKFFPVHEGSIPELPGITHSYEPLFVFQSASGKFLPPVWYVCQSIVHIYLYSEKQAKRTESDDLADYEKELEQEQSIVYDFLNDLTPDLVSALEHGEAVVVPREYESQNAVSNNSVNVSSDVQSANAGSSAQLH